MAITRTTDASTEPVTLSEVKTYLRIDHDHEDDLISDIIIPSVRQFCEQQTRRAFIQQTWTKTLPDFPCGRRIYLDRPPLSSVTSVTYYDEDGASQTLASSRYAVNTDNEPGFIQLDSNQSWPVVDDDSQPGVTITYVAGYGSAASDVPAALKQAQLYIINHWWRNRDMVDVSVGGTVSEVPFTANVILRQYAIRGEASP